MRGPMIRAAAVLAAALAASAQEPLVPTRIVFLGDSITDGNTYPTLVAQALREAGRGDPLTINAGIGGDTAAGMLARLERDVLPRRPALATLSAGVNDGLRGVPPADYARDVEAIADRLAATGVPLVLLTTCLLDGPNEPVNERLAAYNEALRGIAARRGLRVADVEAQYRAARARGEAPLETDHVHPDWAGHRLYARAVLDALGHPDVPVPEELVPLLHPGVPTSWRIAPLPEGAAAPDAAALAAIPASSAAWTEVRVPQDRPHPTWWIDHERRRGFVVALPEAVGPAPAWRAHAVVASDAARDAFLNPGGNARRAWLNGEEVFVAGEWTGWHPGNRRIPVRLRAGPNHLVVDAGGDFFASVTADDDW